MCWCRSRSRPPGRTIKTWATSRSKTYGAFETGGRILRPPFLSRHDYAGDFGNIAVFFAANVILDPNLRMQIIDEASTPGTCKHLWVRYGDHVLQYFVVHFP